jgi:hypothetical protein
MTFRNFTVFFACPVCGVCYSAVQERSRNVAPKVFLCEDCNSVVCGWSVCYDYTGWQRYDRQAQRMSARADVRKRRGFGGKLPT